MLRVPAVRANSPNRAYARLKKEIKKKSKKFLKNSKTEISQTLKQIFALNFPDPTSQVLLTNVKSAVIYFFEILQKIIYFLNKNFALTFRSPPDPRP
jgi:hypothetical protein